MTSGLPKWEPEFWRGATNPRLRLKSNETLGAVALMFTPIASPYAYRKAPLASGASQKGIDITTGNEYVTVPVGYTHFTLGYGYTFDQPCRIRGVTDGYMDSNAVLGSFKPDWLEGARPWYDIFDPLGASAHEKDYTFTNLGSLSMVGLYNAPYILREVGTKRPEKKKVRCRVCGHQQPVNRRATKVRCPKCKKLTIYMPMLFGEYEKPIMEEIEA